MNLKMCRREILSRIRLVILTIGLLTILVAGNSCTEEEDQSPEIQDYCNEPEPGMARIWGFISVSDELGEEYEDDLASGVFVEVFTSDSDPSIPSENVATSQMRDDESYAVCVPAGEYYIRSYTAEKNHYQLPDSTGCSIGECGGCKLEGGDAGIGPNDEPLTVSEGDDLQVDMVLLTTCLDC